MPGFSTFSTQALPPISRIEASGFRAHVATSAEAGPTMTCIPARTTLSNALKGIAEALSDLDDTCGEVETQGTVVRNYDCQ